MVIYGACLNHMHCREHCHCSFLTAFLQESRLFYQFQGQSVEAEMEHQNVLCHVFTGGAKLISWKSLQLSTSVKPPPRKNVLGKKCTASSAKYFLFTSALRPASEKEDWLFMKIKSNDCPSSSGWWKMAQFSGTFSRLNFCTVTYSLQEETGGDGKHMV